MKIQWITATSSNRAEGYGDAASYLTSYLLKYFDLEKQNIIEQNDNDEIKKLHNAGIGCMYESNNPNFDVYIHNFIPTLFSKRFGYNICFNYWETNQIPLNWVDSINSSDELWTTSKWAKDVFTNSKINIPIYNFELGVNDIYYKKPEAPRGINSDKFTFLSIGSPASRKNSQMAVDAFIKLFGHDDRFSLIYKSNGPADARIGAISEYTRMPLNSHPRIKVINWQVSEKKLSQIYDQSNCVLYPTSGEGWGLLPLQGIAKGIPTICTNATACTEFAHLSIPLDFKWGTKGMYGIYEGCGDWAEPDFDDLCDKMLYVVNNYDEASLKTFYGANWVESNLTWNQVGLKYKERLCQISKKLKVNL